MRQRLLKDSVLVTSQRTVSLQVHYRNKFLPQQPMCRCMFLCIQLLLSTMIQSIHVTTAAFNATRRNITKYPDWTNQRNPYEEGCLYSHGLQDMPRTCNSDDDDGGDSDTSKCSKNDMQYMEIRIHTGDWESITYESWIIQILLSEILHIPTTIDSGLGNEKTLNFYHPAGEFAYGRYTLYDSLATAYFSVNGDCVPILQRERGRNNPNVTCAHVIPESWRGTVVAVYWFASYGSACFSLVLFLFLFTTYNFSCFHLF